MLMAKGFQPGNKGGPGRPRKVPDEISALESFNRDYVMREIHGILCMTKEQFKRATEQPHNSLLRIACLALMKRVIEKGDYQCLDFILNRSIGKVRDQVEVDLTVAAREKAHDELIDTVPREKIIELVKLKAGNADE
jgi:hypothetical protein